MQLYIAAFLKGGKSMKEDIPFEIDVRDFEGYKLIEHITYVLQRNPFSEENPEHQPYPLRIYAFRMDSSISCLPDVFTIGPISKA